MTTSLDDLLFSLWHQLAMIEQDTDTSLWAVQSAAHRALWALSHRRP